MSTNDRDGPPRLPFRCGTFLMDLPPEESRRVADAWRATEEEYIDWVRKSPTPKVEQIETAEFLKAGHAATDAINKYGFGARQVSEALNRKWAMSERGWRRREDREKAEKKDR